MSDIEWRILHDAVLIAVSFVLAIWRFGYKSGGAATGINSRLDEHDREFQTIKNTLRPLNGNTAKLDEIEATNRDIQSDLKLLSRQFTEFQIHRWESLDARYQQVPICKALHEMISERMNALPELIVNSDILRQMIRHEVHNGFLVAMGRSVPADSKIED